MEPHDMQSGSPCARSQTPPRSTSSSMAPTWTTRSSTSSRVAGSSDSLFHERVGGHFVVVLDKEFIDVAMSMDPEWKLWVLRKVFDDKKEPYLPKRILYRQKECSSVTVSATTGSIA